MFHLLPNLIADLGSVTWHQITNPVPCLLPPAGARMQECAGKEGWEPLPPQFGPVPLTTPTSQTPKSQPTLSALRSGHSLWAAPYVQSDRWGPGCSGWRVAVANKHSAPWSACVRRVTHCTPVGVDGRSLLLQVSAHSLVQLQERQGEALPGEEWAGPAPDRPTIRVLSAARVCSAGGSCHQNTVCSSGR